MKLRDGMSRNLLMAIKIAITGLILAMFIWKLDFSAVLDALSSISVYVVIAALFVLLVQVFESALRFAWVVALFKHRFSFSESLRVTSPSSARFALLVLAAAGAAAIALLVLLGYLQPGIGISNYLPPYIRSHKIFVFLLDVWTVGKHLLAHWRGLVPVGILGLLTVFGYCLIFFLVLCGININPVSAFYCALLVPAILEIAMLPISIAGWGVREAVAVVVFGVFGISSDNALAASLTFLAAISLFGGAIWFDDRRPRVAM